MSAARQAVLMVGPCVGALGALGLLKWQLPPEKGGREAWWARRTISSQHHSVSEAAVDEPGCGHQAGKELLAFAKHGGIPSELLTAARLSWNGIELALERALKGDTLSRALVEQWRRGGWLSGLDGELSDLKPETWSTYGVNIGCKPATYLDLPASSRLSSNAIEEAMQSLCADGVARFSGVVCTEIVQALRKELGILESAASLGYPTEVPTREVLLVAPGAANPGEPTLGRRHFMLRGTHFAEENFSRALAPLMPLVYRYFAEHRPELLALAEAHAEWPSSSSSARLFLSECQLLVSDPGAASQEWHVDNRHPGLTAVIPLTPVDDQVGPTDLLPGTHHLIGGRIMDMIRALSRSSGAVTASPLRAGDAIVYDARVMKRGLVNDSLRHCHVLLVMRVDADDAPPPGATLVQTCITRWTGKILKVAGLCFSYLPGA